MNRRELAKGMIAVVAAVATSCVVGTDEQSVLKMRRVEILRDGDFIAAQFDQIRSGDRFRLFDDHPHGSECGEINIATSDAIPCEPAGNWSVTAYPAPAV